MDPELLARIIRLRKWAHDVALQDAVLPDEEKARLIRETLEQLERESGGTLQDPNRN